MLNIQWSFSLCLIDRLDSRWDANASAHETICSYTAQQLIENQSRLLSSRLTETITCLLPPVITTVTSRGHLSQNGTDDLYSHDGQSRAEQWDRETDTGSVVSTVGGFGVFLSDSWIPYWDEDTALLVSGFRLEPDVDSATVSLTVLLSTFLPVSLTDWLTDSLCLAAWLWDCTPTWMMT